MMQTPTQIQPPAVPQGRDQMTSSGLPPYSGDDVLLRQLQQQVDFYFSDANLPRDNYLQSILYQNNGAIPIEVIASFPMMKRIFAHAMWGPNVAYSNPQALPPADFNLLRKAIITYSQTVVVDGMFIVHPAYHHPAYSFPTNPGYATPLPKVSSEEPESNTKGTETEGVVESVPEDGEQVSTRRNIFPQKQQHPSKVSDDEASTPPTVSPTSFSSTASHSGPVDDKAYVLVRNIPDDMEYTRLQGWLTCKHHKTPNPQISPVFPASLEKEDFETWRLGFNSLEEAQAAVEHLVRRRLGKRYLIAHHLDSDFQHTPPVVMHPVAMPHHMVYPSIMLSGDQQHLVSPAVYYAASYPYSVLATAQTGMVAVPYAPVLNPPPAGESTKTPNVAEPSKLDESELMTNDQAVVDQSPLIAATQQQEQDLPGATAVTPKQTPVPTPDPRQKRGGNRYKYNKKFKNFNRKNRTRKTESVEQQSKTPSAPAATNESVENIASDLANVKLESK